MSDDNADQRGDLLRVGFFAVGISGPGSGAWSRLEALSTALSGRPDVEVVVRLSDQSCADALMARGVTTETVPPVGRIARLLGAGGMQRAFIDEAHLDVLHVEVPPVGRHGQTPTVFSIHDLRSFHKPLSLLPNAAELYERLHIRSDLKNADLTVTLSESTRRDIHRFGSRSASVGILPPPVDPPPTSNPPRPASLSDSNPYALALGHLEARKNLEVLVKAAASPLWPAATTLVLAGADHGSEAELRALAARHALDVVFTGPVSDDEKWALLSHAQVVAVPSIIEGFGIVAVEAALAGTPVLVSDRTSLPEIFNMPEIEISATEPDAWAASMGRMISDPQWADATAAEQKLAAADYRLDAIASRLMSFYRQLMTAGQPS